MEHFKASATHNERLGRVKKGNSRLQNFDKDDFSAPEWFETYQIRRLKRFSLMVTEQEEKFFEEVRGFS